MTVTYTHVTHTAGCVGGLTRLLFIWKGSLIKQIFPEVALYFSLYFLLSIFYRFILVQFDDTHKVVYELFCIYCERFSKVIPISFLLGFYVTQVVARWWSQFMSLPWPDTLARYLAVYLPGDDKKSREVRRTVVRWVNLGNVLALRLVSYKVMLRFPSYEHLVESGLATYKEVLQLKQLDEAVQHRHQISWYPFMWAQNALRAARREGLIANDWFTHVLIKEVDNMANMNGMLICYGWISIPLVYTQVVTLAVYSYFIACMFGRQYLLPTQYKAEGDRYVPVGDFPRLTNWTQEVVPGATNIVGYDNTVADFVIPCFTILEYLFYVGWLKVAETLLNPFGEDDDDFDTYYLIDRNLQVSFVMVDEAGKNIDLEPDPFRGQNLVELKHTVISAQYLDDARPHMPTDDIKLETEQILISDSCHNSKVNLNIGSKLNLAGSMLSTPMLMAKTTKLGKLGQNLGRKQKNKFDDIPSVVVNLAPESNGPVTKKKERFGNRQNSLVYPGVGLPEPTLENIQEEEKTPSGINLVAEDSIQIKEEKTAALSLDIEDLLQVPLPQTPAILRPRNGIQKENEKNSGMMMSMNAGGGGGGGEEAAGTDGDVFDDHW